MKEAVRFSEAKLKEATLKAYPGALLGYSAVGWAIHEVAEGNFLKAGVSIGVAFLSEVANRSNYHEYRVQKAMKVEKAQAVVFLKEETEAQEKQL